MEIKKQFNLIGFNFNDYNYEDPSKFRHCTIHPYRRLVPAKDQDFLICCECGSEFPLNVNDTITEQGIKFDIPAGTNSGPKIVQAKRKKRLFSESGDPIPKDDLDAIHDMQSGRRIVNYREDKMEGVGEENENKYRVVYSIGKYGKVRWSDLM